MDSPLRNLCKKAPEIFNILGALYSIFELINAKQFCTCGKASFLIFDDS